MKRRALLAALAAAGSAGTTAGCLRGLDASGAGGDPEGTDESTFAPPAGTTEADAREADATDPEWDPDGGPVETFAVGDRDAVAFPDSNQPHGVTFWNRVDREREVRVDVARAGGESDGESLGPVAVPAGYTVALELEVPTRYALTAHVDGDAHGTVTVGREWFDCNDSGASYALGERDLVDYGTASTLVACADPAVASTSIDVEDSGCANDGDPTATVTYDGERVRVDGTFVASNPCYDLAVANASYGNERRTATVVVDATAPEDQACADCVGAIDYTATVAFDRDLPDHVVLRHRTADGDGDRVATATRNGDG